MKSNLSDIVSKYLFSYGQVSIPGIGTFSITDSSSGFKLENDVLTPPTRMVDFSEDISDDSGLVKYLKNNQGYSRKEAEKTISDYSKRFINDLLNYGVAVIPGIGRLSKYASGEIVFDPAKEYLITSNYMLPEIKLTPIDNTRVVKGNVPEKRPVVPIAAAAAAAVPTAATTAAFLGGTSDAKPKTEPATAKTSSPPPPPPPSKVEVKPLVKSTPIVNREPAKSASIVKKEPVKSAPIKKAPPPVVYEDERSFFSEWKWPLLIGIILLTALFFGIKACKKYVSADGLSISNPLAAKSDTDESTTKKVDGTSLEDYLKENPKLQKYSKFLTMENVEDGCVIILGTFRKSRNVIRMKDKLIASGLNPITSSYQGMTRVGIVFPCEEYDLVDYITKLRKSIDRGAWYLSPRMDVPRR